MHRGTGDITVIALIPETECADSDGVTVTATLPNTAADQETDASATIAGVALLATALVFARRRLAAARYSQFSGSAG